jgi:hypothetical protein
VQLFAEVKRHKPSVIYLPGVDIWWRTLTDTQIELFTSMLRSIPPTDPVLVLAITDDTLEKIDPSILVNLFGYSTKNRVEIKRPTKVCQSTLYEFNANSPRNNVRLSFRMSSTMSGKPPKNSLSHKTGR